MMFKISTLFRRWTGWGVLLGCSILFTNCAPKLTMITRTTALVRLTNAELPHFQDSDAYTALNEAIDRNLLYLRRLPPDQNFVFGPDCYSAGYLAVSLEAFKAIIAQHPDPETLNRVIADRFRVYKAAGLPPDNGVLYTGYYEPEMAGRRHRSDRFPVPLLARPSDLVEIDLGPFDEGLKGRHIIGRYTGKTVVPYPPRAAIMKETDFYRLAPPIAWVKEEFDLFNLQVQGSGKVVLADGTALQVHFDGSNGHTYRSIGQLLMAQGKISAEHMSMQAIRNYLRQHPDEVRDILNHNPRYVFFQLVDQGPLGALGVPLTAKRSIALDRSMYPLGALVFVEVDSPVVGDEDAVTGWEPHQGFALAQDTGSAITGAGRADFFWGSGLGAETAAGHMKNKGRLFFLVLAPQEK